MSYGDNWTKEDVPKELQKKASKVLEEIKNKRKKRKFKLVLIGENPRTVKEIEIKDEK